MSSPPLEDEADVLQRLRLELLVRARWVPLLLGSALLLACPLPAAGPPDAGPDAGPALDLKAPQAPALPEPAVLVPCAPGWQEVAGADGAPSTCEPWAPGAGAGCAADEGHFAGEPACRLVGTACSGDDFASALPATAVLYVKAQAAAGGTGTRASPFNTVAAAMASASSGTVLALSKGTFTEAVRLKAGVTVWGACVGQTTLRGPGTGATVTTAGLGSAVKNLRVEGPALGVLANPSGNSVDLSDVVIDGAVGVALLVGNRASVTGHDVVLRRTQKSPATGTGGRAISAEYGGQVTLQRVVLEDNAENALNVSEAGSKVSLSDGAIRGTTARADGAMGRAATLRNQAELNLTRVVVEQNQEAALLVGAQSVLHLTDVLVRDTRSSTNLNDSGHGLVVEDSSVATLTRCAFLRNRALGISVRARGELTASHLVVRDTAVEAATRVDGAGLDGREVSRVALDHAFFAGNHSAGLNLSGATGTLTDVEVRGTTRSDADDASSGLQLKQGASVTVQRVLVSQSERVGVLVADPTTLLSGTDLTVSDSQCSSGSGAEGTGLAVKLGALVDLARVALSGNKTVGLQVMDPGTLVTLGDLSITDTGSDLGQGLFGRGIHAQDSSSLSLTRAVVRRSADVGVMVALGATVRAAELRVDDVGKRACTLAQRCDDVGGSGVVVLSAGSVFEATGFSLLRSAQCGLQLAEGGVATLAQGEIVGHVIGACVQTTAFDVARLADRVEYRDNGRKLDAQSVPLPTLTVPPLR